jgi:hypothetical protein
VSDDSHNAGILLRLVRVYAQKLCVGEWAAQRFGIEHARQHEVGRPLGARALHAGEHGGGRKATEQLPIAEHRRLMGRDDRKAFPDGRHLCLGRLPSGSERVAGSLDHVPQRRRAHDEGLVPAAVGGDEEASRFRDASVNEDYDVQLRLEDRLRVELNGALFTE